MINDNQPNSLYQKPVLEFRNLFVKISISRNVLI